MNHSLFLQGQVSSSQLRFAIWNEDITNYSLKIKNSILQRDSKRINQCKEIQVVAVQGPLNFTFLGSCEESRLSNWSNPTGFFFAQRSNPTVNCPLLLETGFPWRDQDYKSRSLNVLILIQFSEHWFKMGIGCIPAILKTSAININSSEKKNRHRLRQSTTLSRDLNIWNVGQLFDFFG